MRPDALFAVATDRLRRLTVRRVESDGTIVVDSDASDAEVVCEVLHTGGPWELGLAPKDVVLCWQPDPDLPRGVILGRIGISHGAPDCPDELVLEAGRSLTLRVGDGSITIRADGKILIKGTDLVSHAQRTNRIRGGAVAIN
jgi:hypothetical protein